MGRPLALVLLLSIGACGGSSAPDTDCADPEKAAERVLFASIVITGTATAWDGTTATFEVDEIWRGPDLPDEVEIVPEPGRAFTPGARYLAFPTESPSPLRDARCSATVRWSDELAELRPVTARAPGTSPAEDADLPWEWVIAFGAAAAVVLAGRRFVERRRHPAPEWNPDFTFSDEAP